MPTFQIWENVQLIVGLYQVEPKELHCLSIAVSEDLEPPHINSSSSQVSNPARAAQSSLWKIMCDFGIAIFNMHVTIATCNLVSEININTYRPPVRSHMGWRFLTTRRGTSGVGRW
jgi:hypothetical protein